MPPIPDHTLHIRHWVKTDDSQPRSFDAWYKTGDAVDEESVWDLTENLCEAARDGMAAAWANWSPVEGKYLGATAHLYEGGVVIVAKNLSTTGAAGGLSGDILPDYAAAVISRYSDNPGPSGRGRVYIPCVAEINTDSSYLTSSGLTALDSVLEALAADVASGDFGPTFNSALYIRKSNVVSLVKRWVRQPILVTQRRRRVRPLQ